MLASSAVPTAAEPVGGLGLAVAAGSAVAAFCALFFSGGFADAPLVWVGALALGLAAVAAGAAAMRLTPAPALDLPTGVFLGCLFGLAVWMGLSTLWSLSPDRTWGYTNRTVVYAAFALLGVLLAAILPRPGETVAHAAAVLLGLVLGWALLAKCVPALYPGYGLQRGVSPALALARLRSPVGYWNELALLADVTVPVALWLAAPRGRRAVVRAAGALLLFAAVITLLLTYSRFGVALAVAAAAGWIVLDRDRVESLVAAALAAAAGAGAFGVALVLPGITKDGQSHAIRVHDGWVFGLVLLALGAAVFGVALVLARAETRRPLAPERRARVERIAAIVAVVAVLAGIAASAALGSRLWHEFTNPVSSQISSSSPGRLASLNSSNRWRWWTEEWSAFTSHPLAGTGAGTFQLTDLRLRLSPLTTEEPHNTPLQFLGETGIVGFLLYAGAAAAAALGIVRARRRASGGELAAVTALGVGLAAFLVHTVVDMDWSYVATVGPLLLVAGAVVGRRAPAQAGGGARTASAARARRRPVRAGRRLLAGRAVARGPPGRLGHDHRRLQARPHVRPALDVRPLGLGHARGRDGEPPPGAEAVPPGGVPRAAERQHLVGPRHLLLRARRLAAGVRRLQQLLQVRQPGTGGEAVRAARPGPPQGARRVAG